ncbi:hypothetical protein EVAR_5301_1 [Eumeta japonica]|uniref:Uncharacterized protein n=1 Tax=Eumeta variegata TaxID=151549 RepID=A0A4C1TM62_EUMVA|nr:hypothetical protein EVAR_5301_1 [Eumeta japonica]
MQAANDKDLYTCIVRIATASADMSALPFLLQTIHSVDCLWLSWNSWTENGFDIRIDIAFIYRITPFYSMNVCSPVDRFDIDTDILRTLSIETLSGIRGQTETVPMAMRGMGSKYIKISRGSRVRAAHLDTAGVQTQITVYVCDALNIDCNEQYVIKYHYIFTSRLYHIFSNV